jgi:hypothetical protein
VTKLYEIVNTVMSRTNSYQKAHRVLARVLGAHKKSLPVNSEVFMQAYSEPEQPDAAPTEPITEVEKEVSGESEECPTATTPDESDVVPEVMVPDITAKVGPMTEEVVEVNSSEVSAPEDVAPQGPAAVDVAEEKETLPKEEEAITPKAEKSELLEGEIKNYKKDLTQSKKETSGHDSEEESSDAEEDKVAKKDDPEPPDDSNTESKEDQESTAVLPQEKGEPLVAKESSDGSNSNSDEIPLPRDEGEAPLVKETEDAESDEAIGEKPGEISKVEELVPDAPPVSEEEVAPPKIIVSLTVSEEFGPEESEEVEDEEEEEDENSDSKQEMKKKALKNSEGESEESDAIPPKPKSTKPAKKTSLMSTPWKLLLLIAVSSVTVPICTMRGGKDAK